MRLELGLELRMCLFASGVVDQQVRLASLHIARQFDVADF